MKDHACVAMDSAEQEMDVTAHLAWNLMSYLVVHHLDILSTEKDIWPRKERLESSTVAAKACLELPSAMAIADQRMDLPALLAES